MKLEPIAKPIRIRIKIGKEEFSDFNSLKENLSLKELYPLFKDGRLERWFNQIGKDELARKTGEAAKKFKEESVSDYLLLLSLFSDEVSSIMSQQKNDFNINKFCQKASRQNIGLVYRYTKDIKVFEWKKIAVNIISKENFKYFFEDKYLHDICSNAEWGKRFASFVNNDNDYKKIFTYIEGKSRDNHYYGQLIGEFYKTTRAKGLDLVKVYKKELTVEHLLYLYKNPYLNELDIDWGRIFADSLKNWNKDSERIYKALKVNPKHIMDFNKRCAERGIHEAKAKLDPWDILANSDEFEEINEALRSWDTVPKYKEDKYDYYKTKSDLGKQILDFLVCLNRRKIQKSKGKDYFADEKEIMGIVQKCTVGFDRSNQKKLEELKSKNELAKYTFDNYKNSVPDYDIIALEAVNIIRRKLLEKRKI